MAKLEGLRIGAVNYLNTKPLVYKLDQLAPAADIIYDLPSRLADDLAAGRLDVALIPSIEILRDASYTVASDACIGCRGPVLSVKLFLRVPPAEITSLALDEGSRTSAALAQILLDQRYGIRPSLRPLPIGAGFQETDADAVLLIGDRAMHSPVGRFHEVWDLGDQWCRWTGLPFVFAMWTCRSGVETGELEEILAAARDEGVAHLDEIATREAPALGLTQPQCLEYLRDNLNFFYGADERRGLESFFHHATRLHLVPTMDEDPVSIAQSAP